MTMMRLLLIALSALTLCKAYNICDNISPQKDVDWTKLRGSWYHLLFFNGFEPTCRNMRISHVNVEEKFVNVEFFDVASYVSSPKFARSNSIFFRWITNPGMIYTGIQPAGYGRSKFPPKFSPKKKSLSRKLSEITASAYTVLATDYERYIILIQCQKQGPSIGISFKSLDIDEEMQLEIHQILFSVGVNDHNVNINGTQNCLQ